MRRGQSHAPRALAPQPSVAVQPGPMAMSAPGEDRPPPPLEKRWRRRPGRRRPSLDDRDRARGGEGWFQGRDGPSCREHPSGRLDQGARTPARAQPQHDPRRLARERTAGLPARAAGLEARPVQDEIHRLLREDVTRTGIGIRERLEPLGFDGLKTIVDDYLRKIRPIVNPPRTFQRTVLTRRRSTRTTSQRLGPPRARTPRRGGGTRDTGGQDGPPPELRPVGGSPRAVPCWTNPTCAHCRPEEPGAARTRLTDATTKPRLRREAPGREGRKPA
jgi:hypothetical protein